MESNETVLSDVHVKSNFHESEKGNYVVTRFLVNSLHSANSCDIKSKLPDHRSTGHDNDGDFVLDRPNNDQQCCEVITLEHKLSTILKDVGLQVWRGALLLTDFIFDNEQMFCDCYGLELGSGIGLCGIALGRVATKVFCTDIGQDVLVNCQRNVGMNTHLYKHSREKSGYPSIVKVKELDWTKPCLALEHTSESSSFSWSKEDEDDLAKVSVVLAADVIYEDHLTDAFFKQVCHFLHYHTGAVLYLSIEKRINFTMEYLEVACPAYDHFVQNLISLQTKKVLKARRIPTSFHKYLDYERVKELELWEIQSA